MERSDVINLSGSTGSKSEAVIRFALKVLIPDFGSSEIRVITIFGFLAGMRQCRDDIYA